MKSEKNDAICRRNACNGITPGWAPPDAFGRLFNRREFINKSLLGIGAVAGFSLYGFGYNDDIALKYDRSVKYMLNPEDRVPPDELRLIAGYLKQYRVPAGTMAKEGGWTAIYDMLTFSAPAPYSTEKVKEVMSNAVLGQVAITRVKHSNEYIVKMVYEPLNNREELSARITCNDDPLLSLSSWELEWKSITSRGETAYSGHERAEISNNMLKVSFANHTEGFRIRKPLTCLWTNLDAVRHISKDRNNKHSFDMYMDLSSLQRNHVLSYSGNKLCHIGKTQMDMSFFLHLGEGVNPIHYALDSLERTLFVTHGQLGWGLNKIKEA